MLKRDYEIYKMKNGENDLTVNYYIKNGQTLTMLMACDASSFGYWINENIDNVLSGREQYIELSGNACYLEITPTTTKVYDGLTESDEEYYSTMCEVDTKDLYGAIEEWCEKLKQFTREENIKKRKQK